jgi:hypothetical protein
MFVLRLSALRKGFSFVSLNLRNRITELRQMRPVGLAGVGNL